MIAIISAPLRISTWSGTIYRKTLWINCQVSLKQTILMRLNYFMQLNYFMRLNYFMESVEIVHQ